MFKLNTKSLFGKLALIIPIITIIFWGLSSFISARYLVINLEREFTLSNVKILKSVSQQSVDNLRFYDFYQLRRTLHDFYDDSYMDYFALYTVDMKPFATYPATQFSSSDIEFIEKQVQENANKGNVQNFFTAFGHRRFHFQQQVKDENGQVLGYLFMGGMTAWLDKMVHHQILYFVMLGFLVLIIEIGILVYFARKFTKPITQLTNTLKIVHERPPEETIATILAQPALASTCSEVEVFDSVVRKLLKSIQEYQRKEMDLSVQATLGRLASHFAHDIRTPLSTVTAYLKSAAPEETGQNGEDIEKFNNIKKQLSKINVMTDELTSYTKARELQTSATKIADLLENVKKELSEYPLLPKGLEININCASSLHANIDKAKMDRVINNIVLNAAQAISHDNGKIEVSAGFAKGDSPHSEGGLSPFAGSDLIITIKDNGYGILPEHLPRIFDSSFTYGKPKGTGLGLAYCKNVVEAHGGTIEAESETKKGSLFTIKIPNCIVIKLTREEEVTARKNRCTTRPVQWLVVDDTQTFREQWRDIIIKQNLPPPIEVSYPEELTKPKFDLSKIDGAIVDYNYEGSNMTGIDVIDFLNGKGLETIYLCTANYNDVKIKKEASRVKIVTILPKPIPDDIDNPTTGIFRSL